MDDSMRPSRTARGGANNDDDNEGSDDDSDYEDSDSDVSEFDFDSNDSLIGSHGNLMADLEQTVGVDVPSELKLQHAMHGSTIHVVVFLSGS